MNSHRPSEPGPVDTDMQLIECRLSFGIDQRSIRSLPTFDPLPTYNINSNININRSVTHSVLPTHQI